MTTAYDRRKYKVDEIRRMRSAVETLGGSNGAQDRLRTYMMNVTGPEELDREAKVKMDPIMSRQRELQRMSEDYTRDRGISGLSGLTRQR